MDALNERGASDALQPGGLCGLRPRDGALAAFVATLLPATPVLASFDQTAQFPVLADPFLIAALCAVLGSALALVIRSLVRGTVARPRSRATVTVAAVAYLLALLALPMLFRAPEPHRWAAMAAGIAAGAATPWLVAQWAAVAAAPMRASLARCAVVAVGASLAAWVLTLLPEGALVPAFDGLVLVGAVPLAFLSARDEGPREDAGPGTNQLGRLLSVTWLPLLGLGAYAFATNVVAHGAHTVVQTAFLGGGVAALVALGVSVRWGRAPLLPWSYRVLVPVMAALFVVLGACPAGTFPPGLSLAALYGFYLVLALIGCALFLAAVHSRELAADTVVGVPVAVAAAAALAGQLLSAVPGLDLAPWLTVLAALFVAVLLVFLGRTAWNELVTPRETAAEGEREAAAPLNGATAAPTTTSAPDSSPIAVESEAIAAEPTRRDALEARCAAVAAEAGLSPREAEVLVYLARGFTPAYIAKTLVLSISTVRTHVRNIYRKLGVGKREELIHLIDGE
ncbi:helix-turn-helix transcriptional regulator [Adlercreutzia muris]|uniref:helix-turn-helix transcriptional regulator n=1 Tax=Adlercreutzia muris TaxID=1796610 RepID=UPI0021D5DC5E|nr:helix-turn-helix transcriptional regulator [Adlercreutzia muris]MCU7584014.1 helix-turn-helix transcriptional regulator [Adlercreutzia muris]